MGWKTVAAIAVALVPASVASGIVASGIGVGASVVARAAEPWSQVWAPDPGFSAEFPGPPSFATRPIESASEGRQQYWAYRGGGRMFVVTVVDMAPETLPVVPTIDYYGRLIERYAAGSHAMMREDYPETVAGYPGVEAVLDDWTDDVHHLVDVVLVGSRLYMIGSAGPKGHETGAEAIRFRDSFKLASP